MNQKQRDKVKTIYQKLGTTKTKYMVEKIRNYERDITSSQIQKWAKLNPQYSKEFVALMNSFECKDSLCVALEMQDEMETIKVEESSATKLVMTSPLTGSGIGHTFGNFKKIIDTADDEIILVGYVFANIKGQMDPIIKSLMDATERGVDIKIFFEKGSSARSLKSIWSKSKSYQMPELYVYKKKTGSSILHAKALIKDDNVILVTSANMTGSAMERNLEFGILHEGDMVSEAKKMLYDLIEEGYMVKDN